MTTSKTIFTMITVMSLFLLSATTNSKEASDIQRCPNCEAIVELDSVYAQTLIDFLTMISSIPLEGYALEQDIGSNTTRVLVVSLPDYALEHGLDSFDVAKKITTLARDHAIPLGIKSVSATWTSGAMASAHEVIELNVNLEIAKCNNNTNFPECDYEASIGRNVAIELNTCITENGYEICRGSWAQVRDRDGIPFGTILEVQKTTFQEGVPGYQIRVSVGQMKTSDPFSVMTVFPRNGKFITDSWHLDGTSLWTEDHLSYYVPSLVVSRKVPFWF